MLTASQVNDIVKREKIRAAEKARQEAEAAHQAELERMRSQPGQPGGGSLDVAAIEDRVYNKFLDELAHHRDEAVKAQQEAELRGIAEQYYLKMGKGSQLFDDFNEVMGDFEPDKFPNAVMLAAGMEHTPEIMYELAKNPSKLQEIDALATKSDKLAKRQLQKLSQSIESNLQAKATAVNAPAPLSRPKPSMVGADNGKMSLKDFKNAPWLRG
jgi:hypothetical protein